MRLITILAAASALAAFPAAATAAPETTITSGPGTDAMPFPYYHGNDGTWQFSASEPSTFECRAYAGTPTSWAPCTSSATFSTVTEGLWRFEVRATAGMSTDTTPAVRYFTVDRTPVSVQDPGVRVVGTATPKLWLGPPSVVVEGLSFSGEEIADVLCSYDGGAYSDCGEIVSPTYYTKLRPLTEGDHTIALKAIDKAGNVQVTPTTFPLRVDLTGVTIWMVSGPPAITTSTTAKFSFQDGEDDVTWTNYDCRLDGVYHDGCMSPEFSNLSVGTHEIEAWAFDNFGTNGPSIKYSWTVLPGGTGGGDTGAGGGGGATDPGPTPVKSATYLPPVAPKALRKAIKRCVKLPAKAERKCKSQLGRQRYGALQFHLDRAAGVTATIERAGGGVVTTLPASGTVKGKNTLVLPTKLVKGSYVGKLAVEGAKTFEFAIRAR